jgi:cysteine desulfurase/selenocysteine lyase
VFVRGVTEGINLVAGSWGRQHVSQGDEVLVSAMEHHSNIVPWQLLCAERGAHLKVIPMNRRGELDVVAAEGLIGKRTRLLALVHVSNSLGTINPVEDLVALARSHGVPVLIDGAQAAPHGMVNIEASGCDFYAVSGHKMFGPTGVGILYGKAEHLESMPPWQGGGDMIRSVTFEKSEYADLPHKFEAGTPAIADAIGLGAAMGYVESLGWDAIHAHEQDLLAYALDRLAGFNSLRLIGQPRERSGVISFVLDGVHAHDAGTILDAEGVAVRVGHHCAQPVMDRFGVPATVRASFGVYNDRRDVDALVAGLRKVTEIFGA